MQSNGRTNADGAGLVEHRSPTCIFADPFRCRMWAMHDRIEETVTDATCKAEIGSFLTHGQLLPVLGRRLYGEPDYDIELIYGARRLFVARHLNKQLAVKLQELSDRDAFVAMDIENRHRMDISAYERGRSYATWLRAGRIARLPSVIVGAFATPVDILERWGLELALAWEDPSRRPALAGTARHIAAQSARPPPSVIYKRLLASGERRRVSRAAGRDVVVTSDKGQPLFRVRHQHKAVVLWLPLKTTPPHVVAEITRGVTDLLQRASVQSRDRVDCGRDVARKSPTSQD